MAGLKHLLNRILLDPGSPVSVTTDIAVRTQEQLEDSVTYVAEFNVIERLASKLTSNWPVQIDQIDYGSSSEDGYAMRRVFTGVTNHVSGTSYPNEAKVTCTGSLARLRVTRLTDYDLSGLTDGEAVEYILGFCGISFTSSDIADFGYVLGSIKPVLWTKGATAASVVQELDRVFGMATIEIGTGRVVRIPYSRVPYDYASSAIAKSFSRGNAGVDFFENNRDRGDIDAIQNYWRVTGISWDGEEGAADEGCNYTIWAEAIDSHPKLGAGKYIGPQEFSSEIIQSEALAKTIAERLIRWYNREPDTIRVVAMNDPRISVGDLIAVRDEAWGIDMSSGKRYLVLNISRDGHTMTIDGVGGTAGDTGTLTSGIDKCCGTQQEDGTCVDEGENPDPIDPDDIPDPGAPPDPPLVNCDPIADPTCIPGVDYEIPPAPNVDDPFINCTETDELVNYEDDNWRTSGTGIGWRQDLLTGDTLGVYTRNGTVNLYYNTTPTGKTADNDVIFGQGETVCVSGTVKFCDHNGAAAAAVSPNGVNIQVRLENAEIEGDTVAFAVFYAEPGREEGVEGNVFGVYAQGENISAMYDSRVAPHNCVPDVFGGYSNTGGFEGSPVGFGTESAFSVCFQTNTEKQKTYFDGDFGGGYHEDLICVAGEEFDSLLFETCDHPGGHKIHVFLDGIFQLESAPVTCPWVELTSINIGFGTCEENPDYVDPFAELDE